MWPDLINQVVLRMIWVSIPYKRDDLDAESLSFLKIFVSIIS